MGWGDEGRKEWRRRRGRGREGGEWEEMMKGWEGSREKGGRNGWTRSDKMVVVLSQCCSNAASVV